MVHHVKAPLSWSFREFNDYGANKDRIDALLAAAPPATTVRYGCNRAIIFESRLFHASDRINFRDEYGATRHCHAITKHVTTHATDTPRTRH